jgi:hypothetical protein
VHFRDAQRRMKPLAPFLLIRLDLITGSCFHVVRGRLGVSLNRPWNFENVPSGPLMFVMIV